MSEPILVRFRRVVAGALAELERRRAEVNDLNVFPVPDGDTGDNMSLTLRAVLAELDRLADADLDQVGREEVVAAVARAALLGARGNSGVILSQIVRGAAEELASRRGQPIDPALISAALARAADAAYSSVREPAEGTMLTVVRAMATAVAHEVARMPASRLDRGVAAAEQDRLLADVLETALDAARRAVADSPSQLAVLREAGVVDAGAYGLCALLAGAVAVLRGVPVELEHHAPSSRPAIHSPAHTSTRYRYCTNFAVSGRDLNPNQLRLRLEQLGDSVLVVGDARTVRVHLHTNDPEAAVALCGEEGEVSRLDVADMWQQVEERRARVEGTVRQRPRCGVVAVASGSGLERLLEELGAVVVGGDGPVRAHELLAAINATGAETVVIVPTDEAAAGAARDAAELAERPVVALDALAPQQLLAALVEFDDARPADDNAARIRARAEAVAHGGVRPVAVGDNAASSEEAVAVVGDDEVARGRPREALTALADQLAAGAELLTVLVGRDAPLGEDELRECLPQHLEVEVLPGGQRDWWWLLAAE